MQKVNITGTPRAGLGKKHTKQLRTEGKIPCVLYGGDKNFHFSVDPLDVRPLIFTADFKLAEIEIEGETHTCIVKDYQFHPVSDEIEHLDFLLLTDGVKVKVNIPLRCVGKAPGVKEGGKLIQKVREVLIRTTPEHLVEELTVDISDLNLGGTKRIRDIAVNNDEVNVLIAPNVPVASVVTPRVLKAAAPLPEEELEEGETEETPETADSEA
ncbi:50S ribosomal protein L25 [Membranihabitans maritimus]|uniref:50S ribosomal protein L25 n=1 Tax=Membranihabitans maritimus TaxID=2904244 RepID=UPI001F012182|nr:50S ribosomal protein L25 [Membranihabitans maritimus]